MIPTRKARPPALEETKRIARLLRIVQLISAHPRSWTRSRLAQEFELSERMLDNDIIRRCELTGEAYTIPDNFDVISYLGPTWGVLRGESGPVEDVLLRFSAEASP
jgi:hypothetical protein